MTRRMADDAFRTDQEARIYDPHIEPINRYVDTLAEGNRGWLPHVAPIHGGTDARVLTILRDPGPKTQLGVGSGMLCLENDDQSAETQAGLLGAAGLAAGDVLPWNAYPWYINRHPRAAELDAGVQPILDLIGMLPRLKVVLLQGGGAKDSWKRVLRRAPLIENQRNLTVVATYHPSRQALWHKDPAVRAARAAHQVAAFQEVADALAAESA